MIYLLRLLVISSVFGFRLSFWFWWFLLFWCFWLFRFPLSFHLCSNFFKGNYFTYWIKILRSVPLFSCLCFYLYFDSRLPTLKFCISNVLTDIIKMSTAVSLLCFSVFQRFGYFCSFLSLFVFIFSNTYNNSNLAKHSLSKILYLRYVNIKRTALFIYILYYIFWHILYYTLFLCYKFYVMFLCFTL